MRQAPCILLLLVVMGCNTPERAIEPLPVDAKPLTFPETFDRAKRQVNAAQEFFYEQRWDEVEKASKALADTAAQIKKLKPEEVPEKHKATYQDLATKLAKASEQLSEAGKAKSNTKTTEAFQELLLTVRDLRPE